jgi:hypothetical protein
LEYVVLDHSCQVQRHPLAERGLDLYETPVEATETLLRVERVPHCVWEFAAGNGAISDQLSAGMRAEIDEKFRRLDAGWDGEPGSFDCPL